MVQKYYEELARGVALLAEGVDRNFRRTLRAVPACNVALLAEGVDRNGYQEAWAEYRMKSPSSRRAWIEIMSPLSLTGLELRRPPRGGRG